jgi:hypothetical protein
LSNRTRRFNSIEGLPASFNPEPTARVLPGISEQEATKTTEKTKE